MIWRAKWINSELEIESNIVVPDKSEGEPQLSIEQFVQGKTTVPVRVASYFKKQFSVKNTKNALLHITAHGVYTVEINGSKLNTVLAPGPAEYDRRLPYQSYDIGRYLRKGENIITVMVANGWWRGKITNDGLINSFGNDCSLLAQIESAGEFIAVTDESWLASQNGPVRFNDNFEGEVYDARMEKVSAWHRIKTENFGYENLVVGGAPICERERLAGKIFTAPNGDTVIDFGQNIAGYVEMHFTAKKGQKIVLVHGETLDKDGNFTIENFQSPNNDVKQRVEYICKEDLNTYRPSTCYFGFRYAKIISDFPVSEQNFTAVAVYSQMERTGYFKCGNESINRLFENAVWSAKGNFVGVPTDCPTREKSGFTGDIQTFIHTALQIFDCREFILNWLYDLAATQYDDGCIKQIAPDPRRRLLWDGGAGWSNAFEIVSFKLCEWYNDYSLCFELYPKLKKWIDYNLLRAKNFTREENGNNPYKEYLLDAGMHWGEWMEPYSNPATQLQNTALHGEPEVATAYLAGGCKILSSLAGKFGFSEDEKYYLSAFENAKNAYRYAFLKDGKVVSKRMCRYVRPIVFGLLSDREKAAAARDLNALVIKNNYRLNTGFLTTHEILHVLSDNGYVETAYKLLLQKEIPCWLRAVSSGLTTIPERWDFLDEESNPVDSYNHYSYGSVVGWLFDSAAGIRLKDGAITVAPKPYKELEFLDATCKTPLGEVKVKWIYSGEKVEYDMTLPLGVRAEVSLSDGRKFETDGGILHL